MLALAGQTIAGARREFVGILADAGDLVGEPRPITHSVRFYERGDRPLEVVSTRQWYLRNGGRDAQLRARPGAALGAGAHATPLRPLGERPERDWLISRQRYFGLPVPVWYRLDDAGEPVWSQPLTPDESALPIDPSTDPPPGYDESRRGRPGGFVSDPDVLDTWATSSLAPPIVGGWEIVRPGLPDGSAPAGARHHPHLALRHHRPFTP